MRTSRILALALLCAAFSVTAQDRRPSGARIAALSGASAALPCEIWASWANPASLAGCPSRAVAAFVRRAMFGLPELRSLGLAAALPLGKAVLGSGLYRFGYELYNESGLSVGCGWESAPGLALGASVHVRMVGIARYGRRLEATADLGAIARLANDFWLGAQVRSLLGSVILLPGQDLLSSVSVAVALSPREHTLVIAELEREEACDLQAKLGLECALVEAFTLRAGWATNPDTFSAGGALRLGTLEFAYAGSFHGELGWTHAIELRLEDVR